MEPSSLPASSNSSYREPPQPQPLQSSMAPASWSLQDSLNSRRNGSSSSRFVDSLSSPGPKSSVSPLNDSSQRFDLESELDEESSQARLQAGDGWGADWCFEADDPGASAEQEDGLHAHAFDQLRRCILSESLTGTLCSHC